MDFLSSSGRKALSLRHFNFSFNKIKLKLRKITSKFQPQKENSYFQPVRFHCSPVVARYCSPVWQQLQISNITYLLSRCSGFIFRGSQFKPIKRALQNVSLQVAHL